MKGPLDYIGFYLGDKPVARFSFNDIGTHAPGQVEFRRLQEAYLILITEGRSNMVSTFKIDIQGNFIEAECRVFGKQTGFSIEDPKASFQKFFNPTR